MFQKITKHLHPIYLVIGLIQNAFLFLILYSFYLKRIHHIAHPFDASIYLRAKIGVYQTGLLFLGTLMVVTLICLYLNLKKNKGGKFLFNTLFLVQFLSTLPVMFVFYKWNNSLVKMSFFVLIPFVALSIFMMVYKLRNRRKAKTVDAMS